MRVEVFVALCAALTVAVFSCTTEPRQPRLDHVKISITPNVQSFPVNDTARVHVLGFAENGVLYLLTSIRWSCTDSSIIQIDSTDPLDAHLEARKKGGVLIVVEADGKFDTLPLTVAGTLHTQDVTTSQTWAAVDGPHVVRRPLSVGGPNGATLTLQAGDTVLFSTGAGLTMGLDYPGSLIAEGSQAAPIVLRSSGAAAPGSWTGLFFYGAAAPELRFVTLLGCGEARSDGVPPGCVVAGNPFQEPNPVLLIQDVTVDSAAATGLLLRGDSRFSAGSARLSIHHVRGHVATVPLSEALTFPLGGSLSGNDADEIWLGAGTVSASVTWPDPGVPWVLTGLVFVEGQTGPVLTISPGLNLRFDYGAGFEIGKNAPGGLAVGASGAAPVNFSAVDANGWSGVEFWGHALPSSIRNATLDQCGSNNDSYYGQGCIFLLGDFGVARPSALLQGVTITRAIDAGVALVGGGYIASGSDSLVITGTHGSIGAPITVNTSDISTLPPGRYTGNALDEIFVYAPDLSSDETWHNLGLTYHLLAGLGIGGAATRTLTLDPGVALEFAPGGVLAVGDVLPGRLRAVGTDSAPVVIAPEVASAASWGGIVIGSHADSATMLDHVTVSYGGISVAQDYGPIISHSIITNTGGCAITRGTGTWVTDFTAPALGNSFQNVGTPQCGP